MKWRFTDACRVAICLCALIVVCGCASSFTTVAPLAPANYTKLANTEGEATGSLGVFGTAYYFIPMGVNWRMENAYNQAVMNVPGATGLVNVTLQEDWYWWVIGTARHVTITGEAIR